MQWVMSMSYESDLGAPDVGGDWDSGGGGFRLLVVVMNQIVVVSS